MIAAGQVASTKPRGPSSRASFVWAKETKPRGKNHSDTLFNHPDTLFYTVETGDER